MSKYRQEVSRKGSKQLFTATALKTRKENLIYPMRGGFRL